MNPCPKCGGPMGKTSPEHIENECLKCGWSPPLSLREFDRIKNHHTIFGDLRLAQLHITGATYNTVGDAPSVPTALIIGYKGRRWELTISEVFETDKHGKRITHTPALSEAEQGLRDLFPPNHVHKLCSCFVPPTPHCHWCGAKMEAEPPVQPLVIQPWSGPARETFIPPHRAPPKPEEAPSS